VIAQFVGIQPSKLPRDDLKTGIFVTIRNSKEVFANHKYCFIFATLFKIPLLGYATSVNYEAI
jgi:hypothetical protein